MEKQISRNKRIYFFSFFFRVEKILRANILIARELNVFNRMKRMIRTSLMSGLLYLVITCIVSIAFGYIHPQAIPPISLRLIVANKSLFKYCDVHV